MPMLVIETAVTPNTPATARLDITIYDNRLQPHRLTMTAAEIEEYLDDNNDVIQVRQEQVDLAQRIRNLQRQSHARLMGMGLSPAR